MADQTIDQLSAIATANFGLGTKLPVWDGATTRSAQLALIRGRRLRMATDYGAIGNGSTDDSAALNAFFTVIAEGGDIGFIPPGHYRCPNLNVHQLSGNVSLTGFGHEQTILDGEDSASLPTTGIFRIIDGSLKVEGVHFKNMKHVFVANNDSTFAGSTGPKIDMGPADFTGPVTSLEWRNCKFTGCHFPIGMVITSGVMVEKFRFSDNIVEDCWAGVTWEFGEIKDVYVQRNIFNRIDGTNAGFAASGSAKVRPGPSKAVMIWRDSGSTQAGQARRVWITDNTFNDIKDARSDGSGSNSTECRAIHCLGPTEVNIIANQFENVRRTHATDHDRNEVIYLKVLRSNIAFNTFRNCGNDETFNAATILIKGEIRSDMSGTSGQANTWQNRIVFNHFFKDNGWSGRATYIHADDTLIAWNHVEGYTTTREIFETDFDPCQNTTFQGNKIFNCSAPVAIRLNANGPNMKMIDNEVDGLSFNGGEMEVFDFDCGGDGLVCRGNSARNLTGTSTKIFINWTCTAASNDAEITNNKLLSPADFGLRRQGGTQPGRVTFLGNHLSRASTRVSGSFGNLDETGSAFQ